MRPRNLSAQGCAALKMAYEATAFFARNAPMIGTIGTAAKRRTAGSRSDARGTARGMRRTAADSIMASQFYKNGSHDSWESTKCQRYRRALATAIR